MMGRKRCNAIGTEGMNGDTLMERAKAVQGKRTVDLRDRMYR